MSAGFTREDMVDAIAEAIADSLDVDWNSHTGAEAVVRDCGVFELYEALDAFVAAGNMSVFSDDADKALARAHHKAIAALRKARGEAVQS